MTLVERLREWYDESVHDFSQSDGLEPEFECNYCHRRDVGASHAEECIAVDCRLAAVEIEQLRKIIKAAKSMRAEMAEDDGFLHSAACSNWAACESSKRQCAVCDFDDAMRALPTKDTPTGNEALDGESQ